MDAVADMLGSLATADMFLEDSELKSTADNEVSGVSSRKSQEKKRGRVAAANVLVVGVSRE